MIILIYSLCLAPKLLSTAQLGDIDTFDFLVKSKVSVGTYHGMQEKFVLKRNQASLPSLKQIRTHVLALSGLNSRNYDCCAQSCICYAGPFLNLTACPECNTLRKNSAGAPQNTYGYLPIIPQLRALYSCPETAKKLQYRHNYVRKNPGTKLVLITLVFLVFPIHYPPLFIGANLPGYTPFSPGKWGKSTLICNPAV